MDKKKVVALLGSLDTKIEELSYAKEVLEYMGCDCLVIDISVRDLKKKMPGISPEEILEKESISIDEFEKLGKAEKIELMAKAAGNVVSKLYKEELFQGILSFGGGQNARMAAEVVKMVPFGVPKLVASSLICGNRPLEQYVGTKDVLLGHTVADIEGLNTITKTVIHNFCSAMAGMLEHYRKIESDKEALKVAVTALGVTSEGADGIRTILAKENDKYELTYFHANGVGGRCMEEVEDDMFDIVLDMNLHEIACECLGGYCSGANNRLRKTIQHEIPLIIVPGAINMLDYYVTEPEHLPEEVENREYVWHNGSVIHAKINENEAHILAETVADRLNQGKGLIEVIIPEKGFSSEDISEKDFRINRAFTEYLKECLKPEIKVISVDGNINGEACQKIIAKEIVAFAEIIKQKKKERVMG